MQVAPLGLRAAMSVKRTTVWTMHFLVVLVVMQWNPGHSFAPPERGLLWSINWACATACSIFFCWGWLPSEHRGPGIVCSLLVGRKTKDTIFTNAMTKICLAKLRYCIMSLSYLVSQSAQGMLHWDLQQTMWSTALSLINYSTFILMFPVPYLFTLLDFITAFLIL